MDFTVSLSQIALLSTSSTGITNPTKPMCALTQIFFYNVFATGIAELTCGDLEPVDYEVVIPVNMMMTVSADKAVEEAVGRFRKEQSA